MQVSHPSNTRCALWSTGKPSSLLLKRKFVGCSKTRRRWRCQVMRLPGIRMGLQRRGSLETRCRLSKFLKSRGVSNMMEKKIKILIILINNNICTEAHTIHFDPVYFTLLECLAIDSSQRQMLHILNNSELKKYSFLYLWRHPSSSKGPFPPFLKWF